LLTSSFFPHRVVMALAIFLIVALSLGLLKSAQASASDYSDFSQELRLADDDSRDGGGEAFILPISLSLPFLPPDSPHGEPSVFFFASLRLPPATPPPIGA